MAQRDQMKNEIDSFLNETEQKMKATEMKDVYITDHQPVAKKFITLSSDEDVEYYNYVRKLEDYNK